MERSTIFNGNINYFDWAIFNSKLFVYQRVWLPVGSVEHLQLYDSFCIIFLWTISIIRLACATPPKTAFSIFYCTWCTCGKWGLQSIFIIPVASVVKQLWINKPRGSAQGISEFFGIILFSGPGFNYFNDEFPFWLVITVDDAPVFFLRIMMAHCGKPVLKNRWISAIFGQSLSWCVSALNAFWNRPDIMIWGPFTARWWMVWLSYFEDQWGLWNPSESIIQQCWQFFVADLVGAREVSSRCWSPANISYMKSPSMRLWTYLFSICQQTDVYLRGYTCLIMFSILLPYWVEQQQWRSVS